MVVTFIDIIINKLLKFNGAPVKPDEKRLKIFWVFIGVTSLIGIIIGVVLCAVIENKSARLLIGLSCIFFSYLISKIKRTSNDYLKLSRWWCGEGRWFDILK